MVGKRTHSLKLQCGPELKYYFREIIQKCALGATKSHTEDKKLLWRFI